MTILSEPKPLPRDSGVAPFDSSPQEWIDENGAAHVPSERLYWGVLEHALANGRRRPESIGYAFEASLPQPIEDVEYRWVKVPGTRTILACGVDRAALDDWVRHFDAISDSVNSATPNALPRFVQQQTELAHSDGERLLRQLEFRQGQFESKRRIRKRLSRRLVVLLGLASTAVMLSMGMLWRANLSQDDMHELREASATIINSSLGPATGAAATLDPYLRLAAEHRRLEQTRDRSAANHFPSDRGQTFLMLLGFWPDHIPTVIDQLELDRNGLSLRGLVKTAEDYEALALALDGFSAGWSAPSGSTARQSKGYSFTLSMRPQRESTESEAAHGQR